MIFSLCAIVSRKSCAPTARRMNQHFSPKIITLCTLSSILCEFFPGLWAVVLSTKSKCQRLSRSPKPLKKCKLWPLWLWAARSDNVARTNQMPHYYTGDALSQDIGIGKTKLSLNCSFQKSLHKALLIGIRLCKKLVWDFTTKSQVRSFIDKLRVEKEGNINEDWMKSKWCGEWERAWNKRSNDLARRGLCTQTTD